MRTTILFLIALFLCGCGQFNGNIYFNNTSSKDLVVDEVLGFSHQPPVGYLGSGVTKSSSMNSMPFPKEISIKWWYESVKKQWEPDGDIFTTNLSLTHLKAPKGDQEIAFTFNSEEKWIVEIK